jgi:putative DNA primase/helicase
MQISDRTSLPRPKDEASSEPITNILGSLKALGIPPKQAGPDRWRCLCPAHSDKRPSLGITVRDDGKVRVKCFAGCSSEVVLRALNLTLKDLHTQESRDRWLKENKQPAQLVARFMYHDHDGAEVFRIDRCRRGGGKKFFVTWHLDPSGKWQKGAPAGLLPLYRLPELAVNQHVYLVEGEKCTDLLTQNAGVCATTSAHGANAAYKTDWSPLAGHNVYILPDNDAAGEWYARDVASKLAQLSPRPSVRIVWLPGLAEGEDCEQWLARLPDSWGPDEVRAKLEEIVAAAPVFDPKSLQMSPTAVTFDPERSPAREEPKATRAAEWLRLRCQDGPVPSTTIFDEGKALSFSERTIKRAKRVADVKSRQVKGPTGRVWVYVLTDTERMCPPEAAQPV